MTDEPQVTVERFAAGLNNRQLACRELGHVWVPWTVEVIESHRRVGGYVRTMKCRQCKSERRQVLDSRGGVVSNGYAYVDGYLARNVEPGFTRDAFRLESVVRWVEGHADTVKRTDANGEEVPRALRSVG